MVNVSILGMVGDFEKNPQGSGARRMISEIYNHIKNTGTSSIQLERVELKNPIPGSRSMPIFPSNLFNRYKNVDILHNIRSNLLCAPFVSKKTILLNTAYEITAMTHPEFVIEEFLELKMRIGAKAYLKLHKLAEKEILTADYLISISSSTTKDLISLGYNKDHIYTIPLGVDYRFCHKKDFKKHNVFNVGYLGSLIKKKNLLFAINAFKLIEDPKMQMHIYGKKMNTVFYSKIKNSASSDKRIYLCGFAPEEEIIKIYDSFDVLLYPVLRGGFELGILEAQARGVPVIIYEDSEIPEEVRKYCFKAKDEGEMANIIEKIKQKGYDTKLRENAMSYARSFTWEKTAAATFKTYLDIARREGIN